jgi:hypothetical protein
MHSTERELSIAFAGGGTWTRPPNSATIQTVRCEANSVRGTLVAIVSAIDGTMDTRQLHKERRIDSDRDLELPEVRGQGPELTRPDCVDGPIAPARSPASGFINSRPLEKPKGRAAMAVSKPVVTSMR